MSLLDTLFRQGALRPLDHALAQSLRRLGRADKATDDRVLAAAALASSAVAQGHAGLDLARPQLVCEATVEWPSAHEWETALRASAWVAQPAPHSASEQAPLALENGMLYLRRYREYERRLAAGLRRIASTPPALRDSVSVASLFDDLFPHAREGDRQARAAALALRQSLLLVTGGPGTGKTTTITRVLLLLVEQARHAGAPTLRIALASPTGRAAERMVESLRAAIAQLRAQGIDPSLCDALPDTASTLHRLLGTIPDSPRFRHDADHPLPFDAVVIDEASMVDLPLMCKLVEAVPDGARLILLGDRDQLPSVEAGDVLAAITDAAGDGDALPAATAVDVAPLMGPIPVDAGTTSLLAGHRVHLQRGYRQSTQLELAPLADALRLGDTDAALRLLREGLSGVQFHEGLTDPLSGHTRDTLLAPWRALLELGDPTEALRHATQLRLLTALRDGPQGANVLNQRIEEALAGTLRDPYFHGRLLLVTENSYRHGLFNGDIGICQHDASGIPVAWFAGGSDGVRGFHPASLPAHTGAFAMTVHKAQGSEYDTVWLQLPRQDARTLSRELIYTAVTRARREVHVCGSEPTLRAALSRHAQRVSGLAWRLRDA